MKTEGEANQSSIVGLFSCFEPTLGKLQKIITYDAYFNPLIHSGGGGGAVRHPPVVFCPLLKKSFGNPYLKILHFSQLFIVDAPMKKNLKFLFYPRADHFWETQYKNIFFCFNPKNLLTKPR